MPQWLIPILSLVGGALAAWVAFRIQFERFESMDREREKHWLDWRRNVDQRLQRIEDRPVNGYQSLCDKVDRLEDEVGRRHNEGLRGAVHWCESAIKTIHSSWIEQRDRDSSR